MYPSPGEMRGTINVTLFNGKIKMTVEDAVILQNFGSDKAEKLEMSNVGRKLIRITAE